MIMNFKSQNALFLWILQCKMCPLDLRLMESQLLSTSVIRNSCQSFGTTSRNRVFSAQKSKCSPSVNSIWSNFVLFPRCNKILEVSFFAYLCQLHPVSSCLCRRRYQELYFFGFQLGQNLVVHRSTGSSRLFFSRTELTTPVRHCSVDTELIYRMEVWNKRLK